MCVIKNGSPTGLPFFYHTIQARYSQNKIAGQAHQPRLLHCRQPQNRFADTMTMGLPVCCLPPRARPTHPVGKAGTRSDSPRNAASAFALLKQHGRHSDTVRLTERYSCCTGMSHVLCRNGARACAVLTLIFPWFLCAMKSLIFCRAKLSPLEAHEFCSVWITPLHLQPEAYARADGKAKHVVIRHIDFDARAQNSPYNLFDCPDCA